MQRIVIGLVGIKIREDEEVLKALANQKYTVFSIEGNVLEGERKRKRQRGHEIPGDLVNAMRIGFSDAILASLMADLIDKSKASKIVVEGITHPAEIDYFRGKFGAKILGVHRDGQETVIRQCLDLSDFVVEGSSNRWKDDFKSGLLELTDQAKGITLEDALTVYERYKRSKEQG